MGEIIVYKKYRKIYEINRKKGELEKALLARVFKEIACSKGEAGSCDIERAEKDEVVDIMVE